MSESIFATAPEGDLAYSGDVTHYEITTPQGSAAVINRVSDDFPRFPTYVIARDVQTGESTRLDLQIGALDKVGDEVLATGDLLHRNARDVAIIAINASFTRGDEPARAVVVRASSKSQER
jgi:hypothetical protein